jgi:hypothetical protein
VSEGTISGDLYFNILRKSNNSENPSLDTSQTSLLYHMFILPSVLFTPHLIQDKSNENVHVIGLSESWQF